MKIRLADYVADFLVEHGVTDCFSVVGGGAMHLNDAFGHNKDLHVTYNHHEQACAIAAESYARINNRIAVVCVTTGPGGINAMNGVACGWLDSIPMFIISGQVRYDTTARYTEQFTDGLHLRSVGDQEYDIVKSVSPMTKYAVMLEDPLRIRYVLEKAWLLATTGRPGPVWIDIPVNFQGMNIETEALEPFKQNTDDSAPYDGELHRLQDNPPRINDETVYEILTELDHARRPVIYAGYGIRLSGAYSTFRAVAAKLRIPVVTYWNSIDLIETNDPLYCGRGGNMGDRPGNWAVQCSDMILALGTRISIRQTGYNWKSWAPEAKVIMVDIDKAEFKKHTIHVDMPVWADVNDFLGSVLNALDTCDQWHFDHDPSHERWLELCNKWKKNYPVVNDLQKVRNSNKVNVYAFIDSLSSNLDAGSLTVVSNGACCVAGSQAFVIKPGSRFINNNAIASMGYGLPASIGACIGSNRHDTVCLEGDGSIMMNLQELQTIITNRLPVRIFLINNNGYHSIRITQNNLFTGHSKVGIGPESGDLSFPEYKKIAEAFGYKYYSIWNNDELSDRINEVLSTPGPVFCEVFTDTEQVWAPKSSAKKLENGSLVSPPLEDLAPFLPKEELEGILSQAHNI